MYIYMSGSAYLELHGNPYPVYKTPESLSRTY
jgi:hypothetical protein